MSTSILLLHYSGGCLLFLRPAADEKRHPRGVFLVIIAVLDNYNSHFSFNFGAKSARTTVVIIISGIIYEPL